MIEKQMCAILQGIANEGIPPENVDLWPRIREGLNKRILAHRKPLSRVTTRVALPVFIMLILLTISLILAGPERALAALRGLLGYYIPGIGLVDEEGGLRVLADPVTIERDGITITVEQDVLDSEQTILIYRVEGISAETPLDSDDSPFCLLSPELIVPGGAVLQIINATGWAASWYEARLVYPALPLNVNEATLLIECHEGESPFLAS
jgi:hypothetical protein